MNGGMMILSSAFTPALVISQTDEIESLHPFAGVVPKKKSAKDCFISYSNEIRTTDS